MKIIEIAERKFWRGFENVVAGIGFVFIFVTQNRVAKKIAGAGYLLFWGVLLSLYFIIVVIGVIFLILLTAILFLPALIFFNINLVKVIGGIGEIGTGQGTLSDESPKELVTL